MLVQGKTSVVSVCPDPVGHFLSSMRARSKEAIARRLAVEALKQAALRCGMTSSTLTLGDSLRRKIDHGLARSGMPVVLSRTFLPKHGRSVNSMD